jgi:hypothetical protein
MLISNEADFPAEAPQSNSTRMKQAMLTIPCTICPSTALKSLTSAHCGGPLLSSNSLNFSRYIAPDLLHCLSEDLNQRKPNKKGKTK